MSEVKNENYISIQGWMVNELNLKGNELLVYAIIYGFSQAENQLYNGSLQYLADWTNSTKQGVIKNLKSLVNKGYIGKIDKLINGIKFCEYYATKFNGGMQQSLTNNIELYSVDGKYFGSFNNIVELKSITIPGVYVAYINMSNNKYIYKFQISNL